VSAPHPLFSRSGGFLNSRIKRLGKFNFADEVIRRETTSQADPLYMLSDRP
jgi:hypothetical protein